MFENIIEFKVAKDYLELKDQYPEPIKYHVPEWYKKLKHEAGKRTVKGCMPFLDTLVTGYVLKMPLDFSIEHNVYSEHERQSKITTGLSNSAGSEFAKNLNINTTEQFHSPRQLEGSPYVQKNKNLPVGKILNPWIIQTPPGYSCLFLPPMNNSDDRFSVIPGIVDTDSFPSEINFPYVVNGDKYPVLKSIVKAGTPYVQVIPFKREAWKMKISAIDFKATLRNRFVAALKLVESYKSKWWHKKSWK
jgi:hypothetical protein